METGKKTTKKINSAKLGIGVFCILCLAFLVVIFVYTIKKNQTGDAENVTTSETTTASEEQTTEVASAISEAETSEATTEASTKETTEETTEDTTEETTEATTEATEEATTEEVVTYTKDGYTFSNDSSDFVVLTDVVPDAVLEIRYYTDYNFVGEQIDGYEEPIALVTKETAEALKNVSDDLAEDGYALKIYDAYRPQMAVDHFVRWASDLSDTKMKEYFYPELDKSVLFSQGYIASHSGHSRGSTLDLTLVYKDTGEDVDMGGTFDYFGSLSYSDYTGITEEQYSNRMILRNAMTSNGFSPYSEEWWHFTLSNEPYPGTYFTFPVNHIYGE